MTVLASFVVDSKVLPIGQLVRENPSMTLEFERIVPTEDALMPYFWVHGGDIASFEGDLAASPLVTDFDLLDQFENTALYRVEWKPDQGMLIQGIVEAEGAILEGDVGQAQMEFLVRFPDHDHLGRFYNYCMEHDITVEMRQIYSLTDRSERAREFGLTADQREALVLAARYGYFSTPRETSMSELADELGITQQAMSERIRRGMEKVMLEALGLARNDEE
ncbi:helix-turn-helix domain-containing protein [Halorarum salinum]|uniref:Helix-turn-helix domain-containing protein n=1 Tax=Halorarum salinum TaxID=2743089 RepID=A0A7D5QMU1_9EURY|nr:helix-turn-helix domain-containing protein [Halobaculum salinum]QLG63725.1 helix-turn-helix domain-containing protein [Halobaculum salinum]